MNSYRRVVSAALRKGVTYWDWRFLPRCASSPHLRTKQSAMWRSYEVCKLPGGSNKASSKTKQTNQNTQMQNKTNLFIFFPCRIKTTMPMIPHHWRETDWVPNRAGQCGNDAVHTVSLDDVAQQSRWAHWLWPVTGLRCSGAVSSSHYHMLQ